MRNVPGENSLCPHYVDASVWTYIQSDPAAIRAASVLQNLFTVSGFFHEDDDDPRARHDSRVRYMFLSPKDEIRNKYFLRKELLCLFTEHPRFHHQQIEKLHDFAKRYPRLDGRVFFVITHDEQNAKYICKEDSKETQRSYIIIEPSRLYASDADDHYIHELLRKVLRARNHFNENDPVSGDSDFFARNPLVDGILGELSSDHCCGVLGLRRIGKTSVLKRIELVIEKSPKPEFWTLYVNAQRARATGTTGADLLLQICKDFHVSWHAKYRSNIVKDGNLPATLDLANASTYFRQFVKRFIAHSNQRLLLIIDDFQELVPSAFRESPWNEDYLGFAATLKATHLENPQKFVFLLASTNPNFIRQEFFDVQNPLLTSVVHTYVELFSFEDLRDMLSSLGAPMGVTFSDDALAEIFRLFGGHPFLSRQFCSILCKSGKRPASIAGNRTTVPVDRDFTREDVLAEFDESHRLLDEHFHMILENLRVIFPNEYKLLLELAQSDDMGRALSRTPAMFRDNLLGYGIIDHKNEFRMDAMKTYLKRLLEFDDYLDLSKLATEIESALRQLIMITYRTWYSADAEDNLIHSIDAMAGNVVATPRPANSAAIARLKECRLQTLAKIIFSRWELFADLVGSEQLLRDAVEVFEEIHRESDVPSASAASSRVDARDRTLRELREKVCF